MCCIFRENFSYPPVYPKRLPYTQYTLYSIPCIPAKKVSHFLRKGLVYSRIPGIPSYTRIPNSEHRYLMEHYLTQVSYTFVSLVHLSYTLYTLYTGQKCAVFSEKTSRIPPVYPKRLLYTLYTLYTCQKGVPFSEKRSRILS